MNGGNTEGIYNVRQNELLDIYIYIYIYIYSEYTH